MKRIYTMLTLLVFAAGSLLGQPPQAIKYKAIARDNRGHLLVNQFVDIKITLLQGSETGIPVYSEEHTLRTSRFGVMELEIGRGDSPTGEFSGIDWGADDHFIKIEMDPQGHGNCTIVGTAQLLSVPYAFYAGSAGNNEDADTDPKNELITEAVLNGTFLEITEGGILTLVDFSGLLEGVQDDDPDPTNELQDISLSGTQLSISEGSTLDLGLLPDNVDDADADPSNEIQDLQLLGDILSITKNGSPRQIDLSVYFDDTDDQTLSIEGHELSIENGNTLILPDLVDDADADPLNEIQQLTVDDHELTISEGNTIVLPDEVNDADSDPDNEIQVLSLENNILTLSTNDNPIQLDLSPFMDNTDAQHLTIDGHMLSLGNGGIVQLPDTVNTSDIDPTNELITEVALIGTNLEITDAGGTFSTDLSGISSGTGDQTLASVLLLGNDAGGNRITNLADPVDENDVSSKAYVDEQVSLVITMMQKFLEDASKLNIQDVEGNSYPTIRIGYQVWMGTNLKTTRYNDNTPIQLVTENSITPGYCWYGNDSLSHAQTYGALYNWYAVNTGNLCPTGWHVPTNADWVILSDYFGGEPVSGGRLKEPYTAHWRYPNTDASNESGFTALPGGVREDSEYRDIEQQGSWWSATEYDIGTAWFRALSYTDPYFPQFTYDKSTGLSVRCLKD